MLRKSPLLVILLISSIAAHAQVEGASFPSILDDDPSPLLGLKLDEAISRFGAPSSVGTVRGDEPWQDDVAFIYGAGYTFFWYTDRLWQIRITKPYAGTLYGIFMGDSSEKAISVLGQPFELGADYLAYRMPYKSYPVKLKLIMSEDRVVDAYLYRADF
jgi:hypothetical protein